MDRRTPFEIGQYYHLYNRGTEQRPIFLGDNDRARFVLLLYVCNSTKAVNIRELTEVHKGLPFAGIERGETIVDIGCWNLMPNHFHLSVREKQEDGITKFMLKQSTAYSMYFNRLYNRSGRLFQGPFQSQHVNNDRYLKYLFSYIHLNPIKLIDPDWKEKGISNINGAKQYLQNYQFSSYLDYVGVERDWGLVINKPAFPAYFSSKHEFEDFVEEWLNYKG